MIKVSENKKTGIVPVKILLLYSFFFYAAWSAVHFFIEPFIDRYENDVLSAVVIEGICKNLIWTLPAVILICKYKDKLYVGLKEMFTPNKTCVKYLWVYAAMAAYLVLGSLIHCGSLSIVDTFGFDDIIIVRFVGFTEELVFRGWLLNATVHIGENKALALNAAMFLLIHFPTWIVNGEFVNAFTSFGFVCIIALSVIFGLMFLRTRNILVPITLHMLWDLLLFMGL